MLLKLKKIIGNNIEYDQMSKLLKNFTLTHSQAAESIKKTMIKDIL